MKLLPVVAALVCIPALAEQPQWFTIVGDPHDPMADTVQVDVARAVAFDTARLVRLRVSRSAARMGYDGRPYQSYYSTAVVNCDAQTAWHRSLSLFSHPLWRGSMRIARYEERDGKHLVFADMPHNPTGRLIKAACAIALQSS